MPTYKGQCYCKAVEYEVTINSSDEGRTSLCHCHNCKKFTGGPFGITTKLPKSAFKYTSSSQKPKVHEADNGSGTVLHREFCDNCGSGILEYGEKAVDNTYVFYGTLNEEGRKALAPKGEFFCRYREAWMPEIPDVFHKNEIKE